MSGTSQRAALSAAAQWFARLGADPGDATLHRQWQSWFNADPQHQWAWQRVLNLQTRLGNAQGGMGYGVLERSLHNGLGMDRRALLKGLLLATGLGALGWRGYREAPIWMADARTGVGEQRRMQLADGSRLTLNTDSAVDLAFSAQRRVVILRAGEIFIETAKDPRPFIVSGAHGQLRALGTRFSVRQDSDSSLLSVFQHAVALRLLDGSGETIIDQGQSVRFDGQRLLQRQPLAANGDAWVSGSLVVDGWRLDQLLAELQRYRSGYLGCDPEIAHLKVSGAFSLSDIDRTLAAVARVLPVRVSRYSRYWTRLQAVDSAA